MSEKGSYDPGAPRRIGRDAAISRLAAGEALGGQADATDDEARGRRFRIGGKRRPFGIEIVTRPLSKTYTFTYYYRTERARDTALAAYRAKRFFDGKPRYLSVKAV